MHSSNRSFLGAAIATAALNLSTEAGAEPGRTNIVDILTERLKAAGAPFLANDNIAGYVTPAEMAQLKMELTNRAEYFLQGLVIDTANDHNTRGTAGRIAKMYLEEVFKGRYTAPPVITDFPNAKGLDEMYMTGPITIRSACSHHFVPIVGRCWIGIIPGDRVIGLSKFNRIVDWVASRPQIQEEAVMQLADLIEVHAGLLESIIHKSRREESQSSVFAPGGRARMRRRNALTRSSSPAG